MAQQRRVVYAKLLGSHQLNSLPVEARYLYVGMVVLADDDGRLNADPRYLKGQIFSYDDHIDAKYVQALLNDLHRTQLVELYTVDGVTYAQHPKWSEYQKIRKDMYVPSKIPSIKATNAEPLQTCNEPVTKAVHKLSKVKLNKVKSSKENTPPRELEVPKKEYGEFKNVLLTEQEHAKLIEKNGQQVTDEYIESLSNYMASKKTKYTSHYATLNMWISRDKKKAGGNQKTVTVIG